MLLSNSELDGLGMTQEEKNVFWDSYRINQAENKADVQRNIKDIYNQMLTDLATIQNTATPTTPQLIWAVKKEAEILEKILRFHKSEID